MSKTPPRVSQKKSIDHKYEAVSIEAIFPTMDAIAWLEFPDIKRIAQFTDLDPRTVGKIIKNCILVGVVRELHDKTYSLTCSYPYKGSAEQKAAVIKEALTRLPIIINIKQFLSLGDKLEAAARKAATVVGIGDYAPAHFTPLIKLATKYNALDPAERIEDLINLATSEKEERHKSDHQNTITFLSHSSKDKPFIRQLATDLSKQGISVWLDEQKILVGDSITEKISQGLAQSDYFLIALSEHSVNSQWVSKELNTALVNEIEKRKVKILPLKLSECEFPELIKDKKYADFSKSYKEGFEELLKAIK
jgi:hypothetical protein